MTRKIFRQIMAIRNSGETNMFEVRMVQYLANQRGFYDLVVYLEEHQKEYVRFILTGEAPAEDGSGMRRFDEDDLEDDSDGDDSDEDDSDEDDFDPDDEDC